MAVGYRILFLVAAYLVLMGCKFTSPSSEAMDDDANFSPSEADALQTSQGTSGGDSSGTDSVNIPANQPLDLPGSPPFLFNEFCAALRGKTLEDLRPLSTTLAVISGNDSGVVVDGGERIARTFTVPNCGEGRGSVTLRWTEDTGIGASADEIFVRDDQTREVVGMAVNDAGIELAVVPRNIAFDKHGNKDVNKDINDDQVRTRMGCFACHPDVSTEYGVPGASEFWTGTAPVQAFSTMLSGAETIPTSTGGSSSLDAAGNTQ